MTITDKQVEAALEAANRFALRSAYPTTAEDCMRAALEAAASVAADAAQAVAWEYRVQYSSGSWGNWAPAPKDSHTFNLIRDYGSIEGMPAELRPLYAEPKIDAPGGLHPATFSLVQRFANAMALKLLCAQRKYGYSDGWMSPDWMDECRAKMLEHISKGDPRDVANYCAFLWHHGASTATQPPPADDARDAGHNLLRQALAAMTALRQGLESPDKNDGQYIFNAGAVRAFVDEQARLMFEEKRLTDRAIGVGDA